MDKAERQRLKRKRVGLRHKQVHFLCPWELWDRFEVAFKLRGRTNWSMILREAMDKYVQETRSGEWEGENGA